MLAALPTSKAIDMRTRTLSGGSEDVPTRFETVKLEDSSSDDDTDRVASRITTQSRSRKEPRDELKETSESEGVAFVERLIGMVNHDDINSILELQGNMLQRFEKTNTQLDRLNEFSKQRYLETVEQFRRYTRTLVRMKRNLDSVFRRIKDLKQRLHSQYPEDFMMVAGEADGLEPDIGLQPDDEEEIDTRTSELEKEESRESSEDA